MSLPEEQLQFGMNEKNQIKIWVKEYLNIDSEVAKLKLAIKERNKTKKEISKKILVFMANFNIDDMNFSYGKLTSKTYQRKTSLTKKNMETALNEFFDGNSNKTKDLLSFLDSKKSVTEHRDLKKKINPINTFDIDTI